MELIVRSRSTKLSDRQRQHVQDKLSRLHRYLDPISSITVEVSSESRQAEGDVQRVQATLVGDHGIILRADQHAPDLYAATDLVHDVLQRQIKRYKDKHWRRGKLRRRGSSFVVGNDAPAAEPVSGSVAVGTADDEAGTISVMRVKEFPLTPMYSDEAIEQMELLGHTFFVYRDADSQRVSIVYRRFDGNYGLIIPTDVA